LKLKSPFCFLAHYKTELENYKTTATLRSRLEITADDVEPKVSVDGLQEPKAQVAVLHTP
jgi:hypothetical protein